jgi:hypothetical protein
MKRQNEAQEAPHETANSPSPEGLLKFFGTRHPPSTTDAVRAPRLNFDQVNLAVSAVA